MYEKKKLNRDKFLLCTILRLGLNILKKHIFYRIQMNSIQKTSAWIEVD